VTILVRGVGDVGSAVAHRLFHEGYAVVIHDDPRPITSRRGMAFTDAVFDGHAVLDGLCAQLADDLDSVRRLVKEREAVAVYVQPMAPFLAVLTPEVLIDARMRKRSAPEDQQGLAP
jgi:xanthine dehydrogenase accessory factor